ncbi:MAG TPA: hypothetical protein VHG88_15480 [Burkholderiales bacterium]|nr:hypothetical protein [Burkholderiales bacterium]
MKVKTLIACAAVAAAFPMTPALASANATTLGGPQGTGFYGNVDPLDYERLGMIPPENRDAASIGATYDQNRDGMLSREEQERMADSRRPRRDSYSGPSWATNPPAPAQ